MAAFSATTSSVTSTSFLKDKVMSISPSTTNHIFANAGLFNSSQPVRKGRFLVASCENMGKVSPTIRCDSNLFNKEKVNLASHEQDYIRGGRESNKTMIDVFRRKGIKQIGLLVGSEGLDWAQKLRHFLTEQKSDIQVKIAFQKGLDRFVCKMANRQGFTEENGTLGTVKNIASSSDLFLFPDDRVKENDYVNVFKHMKPHSHLGLFSISHLEHLKSINLHFPNNVNVVFVKPIRKDQFSESSQVTDIIACSFAVHKDLDGNADAIAIGLAVALGSPVTFCSTLDCRNDSPSVAESVMNDDLTIYEYEEHSSTAITPKGYICNSFTATEKRYIGQDNRDLLDGMSWNPATFPVLPTILSFSIAGLAIILWLSASYPSYGKIAAALRSLLMPSNTNPNTGNSGSVVQLIKKVDVAYLQRVLKSGFLMPLIIYIMKVKCPKIFEAWKKLVHSFTSAKLKSSNQSSDNVKPVSADSTSWNIMFGSILSIFTINLFS